MRTAILTAALLLTTAAPAAAQSFRPEIAGPAFCHLIRQGVDPELAVRHVIQMSWDNNRRDTQIMINGRREDTDVAGFMAYISRNCPPGQVY